MGNTKELQNQFTSLEKVFFEIGQEIAKLIASCKTPNEQQLLFKTILKKLEQENYNTNESTLSDDCEIQVQLKRYYEKGLVRWGAQQKTLITNDAVMKMGKFIAYDEKSKSQKEFPIRQNLAQAFYDGWIARENMMQKKAVA